MTYFRKNVKHNIRKMLIQYKKKLDSLNSLIKIAIKLNKKLYKLAIEICYNNSSSKTGHY